jgi:hypothetical protein
MYQVDKIPFGLWPTYIHVPSTQGVAMDPDTEGIGPRL